MPRRWACMFAFLLLTAVWIRPGRAPACTAFLLAEESRSIAGHNLDWPDFVASTAIANPRGRSRQSLAWGRWLPADDDRAPTAWISRYGSLTFNLYGEGFPECGMNEAGLVVLEASLIGVCEYPPRDGRITMSPCQWIQYQLDNYRSVAEVLEHLDDFVITGFGWHHLVADRDGNAAVIEFLDGRYVVHAGDGLPVPAITNTEYEKGVDHLPMDTAFGGEVDLKRHRDSYGRFVQVAASLEARALDRAADAVDFAFRILESVSVDDTRRSLVFDLSRNRIWCRGGGDRSCFFDLDDLDLTAGRVPTAVDLRSRPAGPAGPALEPLSARENRAQIIRTLESFRASPGFQAELTASGCDLSDIAERFMSVRP